MINKNTFVFKFMPYLILGISIILGFLMVYLLLYLIALGAIIGISIMLFAKVKSKFFNRKNSNIKEVN